MDLDRARVDLLSRIRAMAAHHPAPIQIHAQGCDTDDCTCTPYSVSPFDPRPSVEIMKAANRLQRWH